MDKAQSVLVEARRLYGLGFNPLPSRLNKKSPGLPTWQQYQTERVSLSMIDAWWGPGSGYVGMWVACGKVSGLLVLDTDSAEADAYWHSIIGADLDATACVRTSKGKHYWFALAPGDSPKSWSVNEAEIRFDVKAEGGGVMAPPSPHPNGGYYEWIREPEEVLPAPDVLLDGGERYRAGLAPGGEISGSPSRAPVQRSLLRELLAQTPEEGGRNNWLIRVAGHYARIIPYEDTYLELVQQANERLAAPLDEDEVAKTADSAWKAEKAKGLDTAEALREQGIVAGAPNESNGWLVGSGSVLMCPALVGNDRKNRDEVLQQWADFDIKVIGQLKSEETTDYLIELHTLERVIECRLDGRVLGVARDLIRWLAERQCTILPPAGDTHAKQSAATRLLRYVMNQEAPIYRTIEHLGWSDEVGGFLTHEGVVRAGGDKAEPFGDVRPAPILLEWAPYRYGFTGSRAEAQAVLRQVLTFHDETVTAVYGAWWAACYLKAQILAESSLFPFMALEAPSESGKTTGFFALMVQLAGNHEGHGEFTMAALRDRVSGHRNGVVWIDDMSDPTAVWDLIRQTTSEGSRTKKQQDRHSQERISLVAPIVISAEGLSALSTEKALSDRAVRLSVPSPTGRMSLINPERPQWDDVKDLSAQYKGDLTAIAGHLASLALECVPQVELLRELRDGSGRHGDKLAILRLGARVLAHQADDDSVIKLVDAWCDSGAYVKGDNILTTEILPTLWRELGWPMSAHHRMSVWYDSPGRTVWYHESLVADAWLRRPGLSARQRQLGGVESLRGQRRDLGIQGTGQTKPTSTDGQQKMRYHAIPVEVSELIVRRADGPDQEQPGRLI